MRAVVLAIGDEVLTGDVVDTNGAVLLRALEARGMEVTERRIIPDVEDAIVRALQATTDAEWVFTIGGLGPTSDDRTAAAMARFLRRPLVEDPDTRAEIVRRAAQRGRVPSAAQLGMARIPEGAEVVENAAGAAPGILARSGGRVFVAFPGPPTELRAVLEALEPRLPLGARMHRRTLRVIGLWESEVDRRVGALHLAGVGVGFRNVGMENQVKLWSRDPDALREADAAVESALAGHVFGRDEQGLAAALLAALGDRTLATAESCTGGGIGAELTEVPGASRAYVGGIVAYANSAKTELLGVPQALLDAHGAVSEPVARAMAEGARERLSTDFAVATTGVAGPAGGTPEKPVGTVWLGMADRSGTSARRLQLPGHDRALVRLLTVQCALGDVWRLLTNPNI